MSTQPDCAPDHCEGLERLDKRLQRMDDELQGLGRKIQNVPTPDALATIFRLLAGIDKRMQEWPQRIVTAEQRADEALKTADRADGKVTAIEGRIDALTDSTGLVLQSVEKLQKIVLNGNGPQEDEDV